MSHICGSFDYSKATPEAHNYARAMLLLKFPEGHCTVMDYVRFYGQGLDYVEFMDSLKETA